MRADGSLDLDGAQRVAQYLVDHGHDGIVVNGTTGESPTTTDAEKADLVRVVVEAVGDRARITAGAGTNDTAHSIELARAAEAAGAHALLLVTPYYNKPPQAGLRAHFTTVADAVDLPVMLYDIPGRTGIPISTDSLIELARHPRIRAVKDAKGDLWGATKVMAGTDLLWFSGDDVANLLHLANGATGVVSVVGHVAGDLYAEMVAAVDKGDLPRARELHRQLVPVVDAVMNITQGAIMAKAALRELGVIDSAAVRLPLVEATPDQVAAVRDGLSAAGLM
jgi:4-hydroxy-tetrahydrodipicolinate synthase